MIGLVDGAAQRGSRTVRADVCVVGTGAGGAPVAKELADSGARVVVVEEGPYVAADELTARPQEMLRKLYRDAGQTVTIGNPPVVLPLGRAVGGSTLVNSGTCFRTPPAILERWRAEYGLDLDLDPHFEHVEYQVGVGKVTPDLAGRNAAVIRRGTSALGWSGDFISRNAVGCAGSGVCAFGCPRSAKRHTGLAWIAAAAEAGAAIHTSTTACRIEVSRGRATAVEAITRTGGRLRVETDRVVVSAGTVHTPLLLAGSGLGSASGELGRNLSLHPATAVLAVMDEDVDLSRGVPQSYYVDEFASRGFMLEGVGGPPEYLAAVIPVGAPRHGELMRDWRRLSQFGLMVSDRARGTVRRRFGRPVISYSLTRSDVAVFREGLAALVDLYSAAGAQSILVTGVGEVAPGDGDRVRRARLRARDLKLMAFHPLGTARAHRDPARGVVNEHGRLHGLENLYVSDGSAVPSALGVNPQITIMALATRLAHHLTGRPAPQDEPHPTKIA